MIGWAIAAASKSYATPPGQGLTKHVGLADSQTDCFQVKRHGLGICKGHYKTNRRIALRANGAKVVSRFRLLLPHYARPCAFACPKACLGATLTDAHFVLKPDIDLLD